MRRIAFTNLKGGVGKTTCAIHVAVALSRAARRVGVIDFDAANLSSARAIENRIAFASKYQMALPIPQMRSFIPSKLRDFEDRKAADLAQIATLLRDLSACEFVLLDCPGAQDYALRLAMLSADQMLSPLSPSTIDIDSLAKYRAVDNAFEAEPTPFVAMVLDAQAARAENGLGSLDWAVVLNRFAPGSKPAEMPAFTRLAALQPEFKLAGAGFTLATGFARRPIYESLFPHGLTATDVREITDFLNAQRPGDEMTAKFAALTGHRAAAREVASLLHALQITNLTPAKGAA